MLVFDLISDTQFIGDEFLTVDFLRSFVLRFLRYLETHTPPPDAPYCRNAHSRWPGISIYFCRWVRINLNSHSNDNTKPFIISGLIFITRISRYTILFPSATMPPESTLGLFVWLLSIIVSTSIFKISL